MSKMNNLIKQLNHAAEKLNPENKETFGDIVVFIRTSNLKTSDVEEFLQQILDSILTAQSEGVSIEELLGTNDIKSYCKNIVDTYKSSYSFFSRIGHYMIFLGTLILISTIISYTGQNITLLIKGLKLTLNWNLTLGNLSTLISMAIMVIAIFAYIKTTCFKNLSEPGKVLKTVVFCCFIIAFWGFAILNNKLDKVHLIGIPIYFAIFLGLLLYFTGRYLDEK